MRAIALLSKDYPHFDVTEIGDATVVRLRSRQIDVDIHSQDFSSGIPSLAEIDKRQKLLLNFLNVEFLDGGAEISKLISLSRKLKAQGGTLKLSNMTPVVYQIFAITRLDRIFDINEDEADALEAFGSV